MTPESGVRRRTPEPQLRTIAGYTICGRLGKGSMGVVYRAIDERTQREVALKVIASDHEGDEEIRSRFFREAVVAGGLCHRNIVSVLDSGEDAGRLYIAMELLTGGTLTDYLKTEDANDLEARLDVMIQVCQGLLVAHDAGVYHRDIKPANLFVCDDRRVKIVDFGIARLAGSDMTTTGFILGTPDFMSPEQARGKQVDARTDIFSAAAVFYLMLTRRKPFAAPDLPAVLAKVLKDDPLPIRKDEAPEAIAAIVHKGLSKDPAHRQQNVAQLASELMAAASAVSASTLQIAAKLRVEAEELIALSARRAELLKALELPDPEEPPVWQGFASRYPALRRGPMTLGGFPLRSGVVTAVAGEVRAMLVPLRQVVASLETGYAEWRRACELQASRNFDQAAERLAAARRAVPTSALIARDIDGCALAIEHRREQEALLESRLKLAEEVAVRRDWAAVLAIVSEVEDIDSGNVHAGRLRVHARRGLDADRERAERERSQRSANAAVDEAKRAAAEGRFEEGATALEAYLQAHPNAPGVAEATETLRREAQATVVRADRVTRAASLIEQARRQFAASNLADAEQAAAQAIALNADDQDARRLLAEIGTAIQVNAEKQHVSRRVAELLAQAQQLAARHNFAKALATVDEAVKLDREHPDAAQLRARIIADRSSREMVEKQEALRSARLASRLALAQNAAARRDWDAVFSLTAEIEEIDAGNVEAETLRSHAKRSVDAERQQVSRERSQQQARVAIDEARSAALEGRFKQGIAVLETCLAANADAPGVREALDGLRHEQQAATDQAERIDRAGRLAAEALRQFEAGDLTGAEQHASQAVTLNAADTDARHLLERIQRELRLHAEREQKQSHVAALMLRANEVAARGNFNKALSLVDEALTVDVAHAGAAQLRARITADRAAHEAAEMAEASRQRRARAAAPAVREARRALAAGDTARARWVAESALAQAPESPEVAALLEQIAAATPEPSPDDTVKLVGPDSGDTAKLGVPSTLQDLAVDFTGRATAAMRRWRSPTGNKRGR